MDEVERIKRRLTKAQRDRLHAIAELRARGLEWASAYGSLRMTTARATTRALVGIGLIYDSDGYADFTPLGLRVRAALQEAGE